ncbi:hypothetical protein DIPPA_62838 [Diplonema papillatum]|nr:hypothetical protein DIPPA_62838 [Diplonema papillatum]KAJ9456566.1 hypothetical protein DIPPA_62838 [Diplonema papillatum]
MVDNNDREEQPQRKLLLQPLSVGVQSCPGTGTNNLHQQQPSLCPRNTSANMPSTGSTSLREPSGVGIGYALGSSNSEGTNLTTKCTATGTSELLDVQKTHEKYCVAEVSTKERVSMDWAHSTTASSDLDTQSLHGRPSLLLPGEDHCLSSVSSVPGTASTKPLKPMAVFVDLPAQQVRNVSHTELSKLLSASVFSAQSEQSFRGMRSGRLRRDKTRSIKHMERLPRCSTEWDYKLVLPRAVGDFPLGDHFFHFGANKWMINVSVQESTVGVSHILYD